MRTGLCVMDINVWMDWKKGLEGRAVPTCGDGCLPYLDSTSLNQSSTASSVHVGTYCEKSP